MPRDDVTVRAEIERRIPGNSGHAPPGPSEDSLDERIRTWAWVTFAMELTGPINDQQRLAYFASRKDE